MLTRDRICDELLGFCKKPTYETFPVADFEARVLADKPESIVNNDYVNKLYDQIYSDPNPRPTIKAVHISDPHIDFDYTEGTLWKCGSYVCCRPEWGYPEDPSL